VRELTTEARRRTKRKKWKITVLAPGESPGADERLTTMFTAEAPRRGEGRERIDEL